MGAVSMENPAVRFALAAKGIMVGDPDGAMRWDDAVSRAEASKMLVIGLGLTRDLGSAARADSAFMDLARDHWAYPYLRVVEERGIVRGYGDGTCGPDRMVTAAEFAVMLSRGYAAIAGPGAPRMECQVDPWWVASDLGKAPPVLEEVRLAIPGASSLDFPLSRAQCAELAFRVFGRMGRLYDVVGKVSEADVAEGTLSVAFGSAKVRIPVPPDAALVDGRALTSLRGLRAGDTVGVILGKERKGVLVVVLERGRS